MQESLYKRAKGWQQILILRQILWADGVGRAVKSLIVKGKYVLTLDKKLGTICQGAVLVEGDKIARVGPAKKIEDSCDADEIIDAENCIVMPGLVCSHNHMYGILSHGLPVPKTTSTFIGFLKEFWCPASKMFWTKNRYAQLSPCLRFKW